METISKRKWSALTVRIVTAILTAIALVVIELLFSTSTISIHIVVAILVLESWVLVELLLGQSESRDASERSIQELRRWLGEQMPNIDALRVLTTTDDAENYLATALGEATFIRNTRIPGGVSMHGLQPGRSSGAFRESIPDFLSKRPSVFREIIADRRLLIDDSAKLSSEAVGTYDFCVWRNPPPVFLNFVIIEYDEKSRMPEVIIGWAIAAGLGFNSNSFVLAGDAVHQFFTGLFDALWSSNASIANPAK